MESSRRGGADLVAVRALLLSSDVAVMESICTSAQRIPIHFEPCCDPETALKKLCRAKFEGIIVDIASPGSADFLRNVRAATAHRTAICFAVLQRSTERALAFAAGANFALERPLQQQEAGRLFRAAYPMMVRERRRSFRYPINCPARVRLASGVELQGQAVNLSETGICLNMGRKLRAGEKLRVIMRLPDLVPALDCTAEVCWSDENGKSGVQMQEMGAATRGAIRGWLAEKLESGLTYSPDGISGSLLASYTRE